MAKVTESQMRAQLEAIVKMLSDGYTDTEIMNNLKVKRSTYYVYKQRLFKLFGDIAAKKTEESIEVEAELLKDRFMRLFRRLELKINEPHNNLGDLAAGCDTAALIALNVFKLEVEGLRARQGKAIRVNEQKGLRYIGSLQHKQQVSDNAATVEQQEQQQSTSTAATDVNNDASRTSSEVF